MSRQTGLFLTLLLPLAFALTTVPAPASQTGWQPEVDLRYRLEQIDDDRLARSATASTLRARLSLVSPDWSGWQFGLAAHANRHLGAEQFNSSANGRTAWPVVADPDDEHLSEAWIGYRSGEVFRARIGRQRLIEDNARFLGNVGFRQLEQTFDAVSLEFSADNWQADLRWLDRAHRVFGPSNPDPLLAEADLNAWLGSLSRAVGATRMTVYAHRLAFDDRPASHTNLGLRLSGPLGTDSGFSYRVELARQAGIRQLDSVDAQRYVHLKIARDLEFWHWFAGHERLGGDGHYAFQAPLATLHAHNGWSDQFLSTPADGLVDSYIAAGIRRGEWRALFKLHDFRAERQSRRYGNEYGLMVQRSLPHGLALEFKTAWFEGHQNADVTKAWLTLTAVWR